MHLPEGFTANDTETVVFAIVNDVLAGYIALSDEIRPESADAVDLKGIILNQSYSQGTNQSGQKGK